MSQTISERARAVLARSLPMVRQHKDEIVSRIEANLRTLDGEDEESAQPEVAAMMLTGLLIRQARSIVDTGHPSGLESVGREHESLAIVGRHYSRFGDALVPILKDVLGAGVPREVPSAWCDIFWAVIGAIQPAREMAEA